MLERDSTRISGTSVPNRCLNRGMSADSSWSRPSCRPSRRRSGSSRRRTSASPCSRGAPSPCRRRIRQVRLDLAERLVTGPPEQHRRALVLLATLELVGLLDELDVLEREADRGRADAEWGGTPAALGNSGATWHNLAGDQQTRRGAAPARPRAAAPRSRPDRPGVRVAAGRRGARPRRTHVGRAPQPRVPARLRRVAVPAT